MLKLLLLATLATTAPASTLSTIRAAHTLTCGVNFEEPEYSTEDAHGNHSAFDAELCKAVAVATLGPGAHFTVVPYRAEADALAGLAKGEIALLATGSPTLRNTAAGFRFSPPVLYDYLGLMVNKSSSIHSARDLAGKKVCFLGGTETETQLFGTMHRLNIPFLPFSFQEEGEMEAAFITGNCAAITADVTQLAYERIAFKGMARNMDILPDILAPDPLALTTRSDDPQWAAIVTWVAEALLHAEALNITQANVATLKATKSANEDPTLARLLGTQRGWGQFLGLDDAWAANTLQAVGNYAELFNRTLGPDSPMHLPRAANNLPANGGLLQPAPLR